MEEAEAKSKEQEVRRFVSETSEGRLASLETSEEVLAIALEIDKFITSKKWNWCTMEKVYRILKVCHS